MALMVRVLVYEGPQEWIERTMEWSIVQGTYTLSEGHSIRETRIELDPNPKIGAE